MYKIKWHLPFVINIKLDLKMSENLEVFKSFKSKSTHELNLDLSMKILLILFSAKIFSSVEEHGLN